MLRIAVCDDQTQELENNCALLAAFAATKPQMDISIRSFSSAYELLDSLDMVVGFHIYLLDIVMPEMNGIDIGMKIREKDDNAIIIYLTSSPDYAIKSYKVYAFQYLMKPVGKDDLFAALEKALTKIDIQTAMSIAVKTKDGVTSVFHHRIVTVEYVSHSLFFRLSDYSVMKSVISREPFDTTVNELLKDPRFIRPHVSFVVNMSFIRSIAGSAFILADGSLVSISRSSYAEAKKSYIDFLLKGGNSI